MGRVSPLALAETGGLFSPTRDVGLFAAGQTNHKTGTGTVCFDFRQIRCTILP